MKTMISLMAVWIGILPDAGFAEDRSDILPELTGSRVVIPYAELKALVESARLENRAPVSESTVAGIFCL